MSSEDPVLNEDEIAEFNEDLSKNFDVLPLFEQQYSTLVGMKKYSLKTNEKLRSRWYKRLMGEPARKIPMPTISDYRFHNCRTKFLPSESRDNKQLRFSLAPGPGVDKFGQRPIPDDMITKRFKPTRPTTGKNKKNTAKAGQQTSNQSKQD